MGQIFSQYAWKPEYRDLPRTDGGFAIVSGEVEGRAAVLIKQRNGKGGSPYLFDLPGGGFKEGVDSDLASCALREALEEVGLACSLVAPIAKPLCLPIPQNDRLARIDCAQAFLVRADGTPKITEEALSWAFVHQDSFTSFSVVGHKADHKDPDKSLFGRTPIMIFDGLSVLQRPFYHGVLSSQIESCLDEPLPITKGYFLLDQGRYLGCVSNMDELRMSKIQPQKALIQLYYQQKVQIQLFYRLNPYELNGRFQGQLDFLAR